MGRLQSGWWRRVPALLLSAEDPGAQIYGALTVAALLAAESDRKETIGEAAASVALAVILVWLSEAYASGIGTRSRRAAVGVGAGAVGVGAGAVGAGEQSTPGNMASGTDESEPGLVRHASKAGLEVARQLLDSMAHGIAVLRGAFLPLFALLLAGAAGASTETAVTSGLVTAAVLLVTLELMAGLRHPRAMSTPAVVLQIVISALIGVGVLSLKVVLH